MARKPATRQTRRPGIQLGEVAARGLILGAAAGVFSEVGARAASVEQILKRSQVSRRTFYRLYDSKEAVLAELYRIGTEGLVAAIRTGIGGVSDPLVRAERCIDAHLANARDLGRLVDVLGAEAQHHESLLYARRREVHDRIVAMLTEDVQVDPLVVRGLVLALEGVTRLMLEDCDDGRKVTPAALARTRKVMLRIATATIAGQGAGVTPLPGPPRS